MMTTAFTPQANYIIEEISPGDYLSALTTLLWAKRDDHIAQKRYSELQAKVRNQRNKIVECV